jgi:hypothetical protein
MVRANISMHLCREEKGTKIHIVEMLILSEFRPLGETSYTSHNVSFTNDVYAELRKWALFCLGNKTHFPTLCMQS